MLCCICKGQEATVHLTQTMTATNQIRNLDLCEHCAESKGVNGLPGFSLPDFREDGFATAIFQLTPEQAARWAAKISHLTPKE
jgi:protein-arginine kinase activator protein McsA